MHNGSALEHADESLIKDNDVVLEAFQQHDWALEFVHESLKRDKEIVLEAMKQNGWALQYPDESLKKDKDVALEAVKHFREYYDDKGDILQFAHESLKNIKR